ncbi:MAG TPA: ABC transporter ATP-binding protein [Candidatus Dormibacteraeota bacterium]|nr:ABC transporter ATP-binding protein [Candidatus Dormibacteraeota bacterium]
MSEPILDVSGLTLRFGAITAFQDITFSVADNEVFAIIGPNGAGKTSLFNVLSRVYRPQAGTARYLGRDLLSLRPAQIAGAGIARTFQNLGLFGLLTVLENVLIGRHHLMRSGSIIGGVYLGYAQREEKVHRAAAMETLQFAGIEKYASTPVGLLPYGIRKLVELARALAMQPRLLLLDEPVAGMTEAERWQVTALIRRMHTERNLSIVLVEHDMGFVMNLAQRVLVLDFGRRIALATPGEVQRNQAVISAYLGEPLDDTA